MFEDAGQPAMSNAFLHILIPLNLTSIKNDILTIENILKEQQLAIINSFQEIPITTDSWVLTKTFHLMPIIS